MSESEEEIRQLKKRVTDLEKRIAEKEYKQMVWLEKEWLNSHGYDPRRTLVEMVEFGIVEVTQGTWDLGILDIKVRELTEVGSPTIDAPGASFPDIPNGR